MIESLEKELIDDIGSNLTGWSNFTADDNLNKIAIHREEITQKLRYGENI